MEFFPRGLEACLGAWPAPKRYAVLASGGRDSTVLLHALAEIAGRLPVPVVVLHFNHGLNPETDAWQRKVEREAASLGMDCFAESLHLDADGGAIETRARAARYARLAEWMAPDDCCLTAHHGDDQAETFLLQALRGCGPAGLAAMPALARFGTGWLGRPLLAFTRAELGAWAEARGLAWIEDPANADLSVPRNWLRHRVWPSLTGYWPAATNTLVRSAALAAESATLLDEMAEEDLARHSSITGDRLPIDALLALGSARRRNLLRHWLRKRGLPVPTAAKLEELEREFIERDPGGRAVLSWPGAEAHRFRDSLHVFEPLPEPPALPIALALGKQVELGLLGRVGLVDGPKGMLGPAVGEGRASLHFRRGGEALRPAGSGHHRTLKNLLREREVLPWMRFRLPLLYVNGRLAAVGGVAIADEFAGKGWSFVWENAPPIQ